MTAHRVLLWISCRCRTPHRIPNQSKSQDAARPALQPGGYSPAQSFIKEDWVVVLKLVDHQGCPGVPASVERDEDGLRAKHFAWSHWADRASVHKPPAEHPAHSALPRRTGSVLQTSLLQIPLSYVSHTPERVNVRVPLPPRGHGIQAASRANGQHRYGRHNVSANWQYFRAYVCASIARRVSQLAAQVVCTGSTSDCRATPLLVSTKLQQGMAG